MRGASTLGAVAVLLGMLPAAIAGQADPLVEGRMLRSASSLESRGDYTGAERVLRELMDASPTSTGGLFALERVLRAQGRLIDVLPTVRAFLTVEPGAAAPRILELRVLSDADSLEALEAAARDWTRTDPRSADVYREIARAFAPVFGEDRALEVLLSGREALDEPSAFAMEIGDLHRELGELDAAVREWSRAVGADGAQVAAVTRRLQALPGEVGELARPLVRSLGAEPTTVARRRAGARIALEVGLEEEALTLAASAEAELAGQTRRGFLADLARRAEDREANRLALWAYESLRDQSAGASEIRSLDQRIAAIALAQGDTSKALKARERVAAALGPGSNERRRALADVLRLVIRRDPVEGRSRLADFRREFPEAPELDQLAVSTASRFQELGEARQAELLLAGVDGPRSAVERGYLHLAERDLAEGRAALEEALPGLEASEATGVIELLGLLDRLGEDARVRIAWAVAVARQGRTTEALSELRDGMEEVSASDRPAVLSQAARIAEAGDDPRGAAELRATLVEDYPDALETAEAALYLARYRGASADGIDEAVDLLETLILSKPRSAVVPLARRELERLKRQGGGR